MVYIWLSSAPYTDSLEDVDDLFEIAWWLEDIAEWLRFTNPSIKLLGIFSVTFIIQGCVKISLRLILSWGLILRQALMRSSQPGETCVLNCISPLEICWSVSKGTSPHTMSYSRMPRDQTVRGAPWYLPCSIHSGGEYTRVPGMKLCYKRATKLIIQCLIYWSFKLDWSRHKANVQKGFLKIANFKEAKTLYHKAKAI